MVWERDRERELPGGKSSTPRWSFPTRIRWTFVGETGEPNRSGNRKFLDVQNYVWAYSLKVSKIMGVCIFDVGSLLLHMHCLRISFPLKAGALPLYCVFSASLLSMCVVSNAESSVLRCFIIALCPWYLIPKELLDEHASRKLSFFINVMPRRMMYKYKVKPIPHGKACEAYNASFRLNNMKTFLTRVHNTYLSPLRNTRNAHRE